MTSNNDPWAKLRADVFAAFMACGTGGTGTAGSYVDINATESNESPGHVGAGTSVEHVTSGSTRAEVDSQLGSDTSAGSATSSDQSVIRRMVDEAVDRADKANRVQLQSLVKDNDALKMEVEALKAVVENNNPMTDVKVLTEAVNKLVKENQDLVEKNQDLVKENEDLKHKLKAFTVKIENDANATKREPDEEFKGLII